MDQLGLSVSSFDCDILRSVFTKSVVEDSIPEDQWLDYAAKMIRDFTGNSMVDPELLERIVRK